MAKLVDALDSKSSLAYTRCRFESGLRYISYKALFYKAFLIIAKINSKYLHECFRQNYLIIVKSILDLTRLFNYLLAYYRTILIINCINKKGSPYDTFVEVNSFCIIKSVRHVLVSYDLCTAI